jgi:hypothetical protein
MTHFKVFGKNLGPLNTIKYYFSTANKAIVDLSMQEGLSLILRYLYPNVDGNKKLWKINTLPALKLQLSHSGDGEIKQKKM